MKKIAIVLFAGTLTAGAAAQAPSTPAPAPAAPATPQKTTMLASLQRMQQNAQRDLLEAAELMPEEHYGFRATPEVKPFGQIIAHVGLARMGVCSNRAGKENPYRGQKEDAPRTKAQLVAILKEASALCAAAQQGFTDDAVIEMVKIGTAGNEISKAGFLVGDVVHSYEVYGTLAVYLRLKGLVPPSTARANAARKSSSQ